MSIEAIWTIRFGSAQAPEDDLNGGVAIIESGRVFGGDSGYAYVGEIEVTNQNVRGKLKILRHDRSFESMYSRSEDEFEITFSGHIVSDDQIVGDIHRAGFPSARLVLRRLASLP